MIKVRFDSLCEKHKYCLKVMRNGNRGFYKLVIRLLFILCFIVCGCHFTHGAFAVLVAILGLFSAFARKFGIALSCYVLLPFLVELNPIVVNSGGMAFSLAVRLGPLFIGLVLAVLAGQRKGNCLPFGFLLPYLGVSLLSSATGWMPKVSLLKIVNFGVFLVGIWLGTRDLDRRPADLVLFRSLFMAMAIFLILGSALLLPFPGISELNGLDIAKHSGDVELANEMMRDLGNYQTLFCGITNQSQALGTLLGMMFTWLLADMLFVEKQFDKIHVGFLTLSIPLLFYTRSRCALLVLCVGSAVVCLYAVPKMRISHSLRSKLRQGIWLSAVALALLCVVMEVKNQTISRWVRKTDNVQDDGRGLTAAFTESRMGKVEESLRDFRMNPLFGMGFQVAEYSRRRAGKGFILTSPIEKGVLPTMILGEAGVAGFLVFCIFLISFYATCSRRRYVVTIALFTTMLATNMGEATFFSPGGSGGVLWTISMVGGFSLDMLILSREHARMV